MFVKTLDSCHLHTLQMTDSRPQSVRITGHNHIQTYPFVCFLTPSICSPYSSIHPFVCYIVPFVPNRQFSAGITLIELIVVLLVVGILAGIAVPNFQPFILNQRISSHTNDLVVDLATARSEAVKRGTPVTVCKTLNPSPSVGLPACDSTVGNPWTTGRLIFSDTDGDGVLDANEQLIRVRAPLEGVSIRLGGDGSATGTANFVVFRTDGTTSLTAESQWILCDQRGSLQGRAIVLNAAGRTRIPPKSQNMTNVNNSIVCPP